MNVGENVHTDKNHWVPQRHVDLLSKTKAVIQFFLLSVWSLISSITKGERKTGREREQGEEEERKV